MEEMKSQQGGEVMSESSPPTEVMDMETLLAQEGLAWETSLKGEISGTA